MDKVIARGANFGQLLEQKLDEFGLALLGDDWEAIEDDKGVEAFL